VLDACRDNPFRGMRSAGGRGLALMNAGEGTLLAYATSPGRTADDNAVGNNGLYTGYLMQALRQPGLKLEDVFKRAAELVQRASQGAQVPWYSSNVLGEFYFLDRETLSAPGVGPSALKLKLNLKDGLTYVWIPPGRFLMGCSPGDSDCHGDEKPIHPVILTKGFWIGQTPVTVAAYKRYAQATHRPMPVDHDDLGRKLNAAADDRQPVVAISWDEAGDYCGWAGMRLPTEAEWEYAARAGTTGAHYGNLDDIAWHGDNSGRTRIDATSIWLTDVKNYYRRLLENGHGPKPVGQKQANPWGLYDMQGNVWQWVADWYDQNYYQTSERADPAGPARGEYRVLRGGSWNNVPADVRVSDRFRGYPNSRVNYLGVRCVGE